MYQQQQTTTRSKVKSPSSNKNTAIDDNDEINKEKHSEKIGETWFNLLQNLKNCRYLSQSPNNKPYELTPTIANVAIVSQHLLCGGSKASMDDCDKEELWTSLDDLANKWNSPTKDNNSRRPNLQVESRRRAYRAALGEELIHQEISIVSLDGSHNAIELNLNKKHGLATVTHLRKNCIPSTTSGSCLHDKTIIA